MTRSYMVEWLIKNTGRFAEDLEEMSTEDIATEYEAEHAEAQQAEADRRYRSLKPKERIQAGIELARDVETVLGDYLEEAGVPFLDVSAGSYYYGSSEAKIRISDHDPRPTYERAFGRAGRDVNSSPVPRHNATHEAAGKSVSELKDLAKALAAWYAQQTPAEDED